MTNAVEIGKEVYNNKHFTVVIGKSVHSDKDVNCYQIINKKYNVIERESSNLVTVLMDADGMSDALTELEEEKSIIDIPEDKIILN